MAGFVSLKTGERVKAYLWGWDPDTRTGREKLDDAIDDMLVGGLSGLMGATNLLGYDVQGVGQEAAVAPERKKSSVPVAERTTGTEDGLQARQQRQQKAVPTVGTVGRVNEEQSLIPPEQLKAFFRDMFIADALLGNFDRHNGSWGVLVDERKQTAEIAPIYGCDSCLYPQLGVSEMGRCWTARRKLTGVSIAILPRRL